MNNAVILGACRTPGGKFAGTLQSVPAPDLGAIVIREAFERSGIPAEAVAEIVMGNGWQGGVGANPARIAAWRSERLKEVPAYTVNKRCASGLKSVALVADRIRLGDIRAGIGGGMESANNVPYLLLVLAVLFWSGNFIVGRLVRADIPPIALAFWRWVGASALVFCFAWPHLRRDRLCSFIVAENLPSVRVAQKIGMTWWMAARFKGFEVSVYSITRREWNALNLRIDAI